MTTTHSSTAPPPPPMPGTRSRRSGLRIALALALLLVLGAGALTAAAWLGRDTESGSSAFPTVHTIRFVGDAAQLTLTETDRGDVQVSWEAQTSPWREAQVTAEVDDGVLVVTADCPDLFVTFCSTETDITVPHGTLDELDVQLGAGTLRTSATSAAVVASIDAGDVLLQEHRGSRAVVRVDAGQVEVDSRAVPQDLDVVVDVGGIAITVPQADYDVDTSVDIGIVTTSVREAEDAPNRISAHVDVGDVDIDMR